MGYGRNYERKSRHGIKGRPNFRFGFGTDLAVNSVGVVSASVGCTVMSFGFGRNYD